METNGRTRFMLVSRYDVDSSLSARRHSTSSVAVFEFYFGLNLVKTPLSVLAMPVSVCPSGYRVVSFNAFCPLHEIMR
jgi:hypothetical protein